MSKGSAGALQALLEISGRFDKLADKDFAAAASVLIRKLMISAGQTTEDMAALKAAAGDEIFETTLKSLTPHQAKQLARRLDKSAPETEVNTAASASAYVLQLLAGTAAEETAEAPAAGEAPAEKAAAEDTSAEEAEETVSEDTAPDDDTPKPTSAYFGRKAFRTGN